MRAYHEFGSRLINEGYDFTLTKYDVDRTGFQIALGYKWNENVYSELGYLDLGDVRINLKLNVDEDQIAFGKSFAKHYPNSGDGLTFVQGYKFLLEDHWSVSPEVGMFAIPLIKYSQISIRRYGLKSSLHLPFV